MKKTSLYELHIKYGGEIVDFAGWALPVQYPKGIIHEHRLVRNGVGLFDVSHMGEFMFTGKGAEAAINHLLTNDYTGMPEGKVRYSLMCNEKGGIVDDVVVYKFNDEKFMMVVNAGNREKDVEWIKKNLLPDCVFEDISDSIGQIAIQGPLAQDVMHNSCGPVTYYSFLNNVNIGGVKCLVSATGYTGEKGYEIYCDAKDTPKVYELLMAAGKEFGIEPCGLGARDTLRMEAGMPLYGHELSEDILATETGLDFAIKLNKNFIGSGKLKYTIMKYIRTGAKFLDRGIAREGTKIYCGDEEVGYVTSGTHSPTLEYPIAMIRIRKEYCHRDAAEATSSRQLIADVRGRKLRTEIVPLPFYKVQR